MIFANYVSTSNQRLSGNSPSVSREDQQRRKSTKTQSYRIFILSALAFVCYWLPQFFLAPEYHYEIVQKQKNNNTDNGNTIAVYHFQKEPNLLDQYNPDLLIPNSPNHYVNIDEVHVKGYVHKGVWLALRNSNGEILFLKRGPQLVTCPNYWSLVGEHTELDEHVEETVKRAVYEELGSQLWERHVDYVLNLSPNHEPYYVLIEYDTSHGYRIDRQLTWLVLVQLKGSKDDLDNIINFDNEVAEHLWYPQNQIEVWLKDNPDDFCLPVVAKVLAFMNQLLP